jgi:hypothetical protein
MRPAPDNPTDAGWPAVYALMERWAELPPASWHALLTADVLASDEGAAPQPDEMERWLIRDLVETAWSLANKQGRFTSAPWTLPARAALERVAWRVLDPRPHARGANERYWRILPWTRGR